MNSLNNLGQTNINAFINKVDKDVGKKDTDKPQELSSDNVPLPSSVSVNNQEGSLQALDSMALMNSILVNKPNSNNISKMEFLQNKAENTDKNLWSSILRGMESGEYKDFKIDNNILTLTFANGNNFEYNLDELEE